MRAIGRLAVTHEDFDLAERLQVQVRPRAIPENERGTIGGGAEVAEGASAHGLNHMKIIAETKQTISPSISCSSAVGEGDAGL